MSQHEPAGASAVIAEHEPAGAGLEELLRQRAQAAIAGAKQRNVERENRRQSDSYVHRIICRLAGKLGWIAEEKKEREKMRQKALSWEKANATSGTEGSRRKERRERKEGRRRAASSSYEEVPGGGQFLMMLLKKNDAAGKQNAGQEEVPSCMPSTEDWPSRKQSEGDESSSLHSDPAIQQVSSGRSPMLGPTAHAGSKAGSSPALGPAVASWQSLGPSATASKGGKVKSFGAGGSEVSKASSKILGKVQSLASECGAAAAAASAEGNASQVRGAQGNSGERRSPVQGPSSRHSPSMAPASAPGWYSGSSSTWPTSSSGYSAAPSASSHWSDWKAEKSTPPRSRAATASSGSPGFGPSASLGLAAAELEEQRRWEKTKVFELPEFFRDAPSAGGTSAHAGRSRGNTWDEGCRYWDELPPGALWGIEDEPAEVLKPAGRRRRGVVPAADTEQKWQ
eukprot:TRINITY_DN103971_c0_g1_i1.p1 TRINITY_DN103971_c0_g1~~TRINITY_DN103971_c0_g1_i1.p1  ORF type:complete len:454 (+),score=116.44 TRINITY_DN103971_c0_g1_i1:64-1425(+)